MRTMFRQRSGYEVQQRQRTDGEYGVGAGTDGASRAQRTVLGAGLLSVFPVAFVAAVSYPAVATTMVVLAVAMVFGGRYARGVLGTVHPDRASSAPRVADASKSNPAD